MREYVSFRQEAKKAAEEKARKPSVLAVYNEKARKMHISYGQYINFLKEQEKANTAQI